MAKRPSLSEVIKRDDARPEPTQPPVGENAEPTREQPSTDPQREPGKLRRGWVQLNVYIPKEVRTAVKVKALQEGKDVSDVVTELLKGWLTDG